WGVRPRSYRRDCRDRDRPAPQQHINMRRTPVRLQEKEQKRRADGCHCRAPTEETSVDRRTADEEDAIQRENRDERSRDCPRQSESQREDTDEMRLCPLCATEQRLKRERIQQGGQPHQDNQSGLGTTAPAAENALFDGKQIV